MSRELEFVDPYSKRLGCEDDYVSPAWDDEQAAYYTNTVVTAICSGTSTTLTITLL